MARRRALPVLTIVVVAGTALLAGGPAALAGPSQSAVVSAVPQDGTPQILDGAVYAAAQVGSTMVLGGSFTKVANPSSATPYSTPYVVAVDASTGAVQTAFAPRLDGDVDALLPGPTAGTVYAGGTFKNAAGVAVHSLVLLNLSDGSRVSSFAMPNDDGTVQTVKRVGNRLYVGGTFKKVGGAAHGGLVTLDATTGAVDPYLDSQVAVNHNWTPGSTGAKGAVGVFRLDITPDGRTMVAIGNFKQVDGATHDQIAMWDLFGAGSAALRPWNTTRLSPACLKVRYDSYVRDVSFSPDGSYFSLVNTGGAQDGALCDSASRWETGATGQDVQPTWVDYTGRDSLLSTVVTGEAVYVGGHQRWLNNGLGHDNAGPGAVPRPGLAALDPATGVPLAWNPGRNPRGVGAGLLYATATGLWVGSDTSYIGNKTYLRQRVAFFPLAGGAPTASKTVATLPGEAYLGTVPATPTTDVLYRVDAGGPLVQSIDSGPNWAADTATSSPLHNAGSTITPYGSPVASLDASVPPGTPTTIFSSERVDPGKAGDGKEMLWHFAVPAGTAVDVRIYVAARCTCDPAPGKRVFDVTSDGTTALDDVDPAAAGTQTGTMLQFSTTSDGSVDVGFVHETGNPAISGIEVVKAGTGPWPHAAGSLAGRSFTGTTAGAAQPVSGPLPVTDVRGATLVGGTLFYGRTDGNLYRRSLSGTTFGPETRVDPYNDPYWSTVQTGSGNVYRGTKPGFYAEIPNVTSMFYDGTGRMYYTLYKQSSLFWRSFSPDSGIISWDEHTVAGVSLPDITGTFLANGSLYWAKRADGTLSRASFDGTTLGGATVVSGPGRDGVDWRSRVLYLGTAPGSNATPTASFTVRCTASGCSTDGTASSDPDGSIASWSWAWGDGSAKSTGPTATHTYAKAGTYTIYLTVTDNGGATALTTRKVKAQAPPTSSIAFRGATTLKSNTETSLAVPVPDGTRTGDALLLKVSTSGDASDPQVPAGWSEVARQTAGGALTVLWQHVARAQDTPGSIVPVTLATKIKSSTTLLAYGGTATTPVSAVSSSADPATVTDHVAPAVPVGAGGSWVVHLWTDKSSGTTAWTVTGGVLRADAYGTGAGYLTSVAVDTGAATPGGTAPEATASTDVASRATEFSVVLAPR